MGFFRVDSDGVTDLTPDFQPMMLEDPNATSYVHFDVSASGHVAYPTKAGRAAIVELATGSKRVLDHELYPWGTKDNRGNIRSDTVDIGPDGSYVIIAQYSSANPEDPWEFPIVVLGDEISPAHLSASYGGFFSDGYSGEISLSPWKGTAAGVFLPYMYERGQAHLVGLGDPIPLGKTKPRGIRGNHLFVQTEAGAAILELGTGALHPIQEGSQVGYATPFRWGGPVAISYQTCFLAGEHGCRSGAWSIASWTRERGSQRILTGDLRPSSLAAVGPDGSVVVARFFLGDEEPEDPHWGPEYDRRLFLYSPEGRLVREFEMDRETYVDGLGGEHFAVLLRQHRQGRERRDELVAIDWATGEEKLLVSGSSILRWSLDHSDRRVMAIVRTSAGSEELWAGNVSL